MADLQGSGKPKITTFQRTSFHFPFSIDFKGGFFHLMGSIFTNTHFNMFYVFEIQKEGKKVQDNPLLCHRNRNDLDYLPTELHPQLNTYTFHMHKTDMQEESSGEKNGWHLIL